MKCTNKKKFCLASATFILCTCLLTGCGSAETYATDYEKTQYNKSLVKSDGFAKELCVTASDVELDGYTEDEELNAAGLFDVNNAQVVYADKLFDQIYPASTTKVLTAYVALKYGNMDDIVTVSENAVNFEEDAQVCGLEAGDKLTMYDLMNGLLLYSGNDAAAAIAEHVSGSTELFVQQMNTEAQALGATHTNFTNPHGLHEEDHYTTAYDLYLMFNACCKNQQFIDIISQTSYNANITNSAGELRTVVWEPTNYYSTGLAQMPDGVRVLGGKTGTTDEAGSCVILYNQDMANNPFISVVMGAYTKDQLYADTSDLLSVGIVK